MANCNIAGNLDVSGKIKNNDMNPIGTIIAFIGTTSPNHWLYCDGTSFAAADYPILYQLLGSNILPDLRDGCFLEGGSEPKIKKAAGLPNIQGIVQDIMIDDGANIISGSGAFSLTTGQRIGKSWSSYNNTGTKQLNFNAQSSDAIYGNSTTVQPKSYTVRYLIKAK